MNHDQIIPESSGAFAKCNEMMGDVFFFGCCCFCLQILWVPFSRTMVSERRVVCWRDVLKLMYTPGLPEVGSARMKLSCDGWAIDVFFSRFHDFSKNMPGIHFCWLNVSWSALGVCYAILFQKFCQRISYPSQPDILRGRNSSYVHGFLNLLLDLKKFHHPTLPCPQSMSLMPVRFLHLETQRMLFFLKKETV